jgi:hypothetical protein
MLVENFPMDEIVINKMSAGEMLLLDQTPVERWCLGIVPTLNFLMVYNRVALLRPELHFPVLLLRIFNVIGKKILPEMGQ